MDKLEDYIDTGGVLICWTSLIIQSGGFKTFAQGAVGSFFHWPSVPHVTPSTRALESHGQWC